MLGLEQFRSYASGEGICEEYALLWDKAGSKRQLMDLAMSVQGADFLCDTIARGAGVITSDLIVSKFGRYLNGAYCYEDGSGYSSELYCKHYGAIDVDVAIVILIDCDVTLSVPDWMVCDIYATGVTNISVVGGGRVRLIAYGDAGDVTVESVDAGCRFRRVQKREWSRGRD